MQVVDLTKTLRGTDNTLVQHKDTQTKIWCLGLWGKNDVQRMRIETRAENEGGGGALGGFFCRCVDHGVSVCRAWGSVAREGGGGRGAGLDDLLDLDDALDDLDAGAVGHDGDLDDLLDLHDLLDLEWGQGGAGEGARPEER